MPCQIWYICREDGTSLLYYMLISNVQTDFRVYMNTGLVQNLVVKCFLLPIQSYNTGRFSLL